MKVKKLLKFIIILLSLIILVVGGYLIYAFKTYTRLPDRTYPETDITGSYSYFNDGEALNAGRAYNIMTYNIGFGAYTSDYSFFADGGKSSWAESEETLLANICEITDLINFSGSDFVLLQEVDLDGTRTYHVNELEMINKFVKGYYYNMAVNYDSSFMFYPLYQPHGKNKSCIVTYSSNPIIESVRRSLPVEESFNKFFDLDRCYMVTKIPTANEKKLCIYNVHLSAYTDDDTIKRGQIQMLLDDMLSEYKLGNYVICGGDFNRNIKKEHKDNVPSWAMDFPREMIPKGFSFAIDKTISDSVAHDSCRNADIPYDEEKSLTVTVDGFIISDNISVNFYTNMDCGYEYSDHDPVLMQFILKE